MSLKNSLCITVICALSACGRMDHFGKPPSFTPPEDTEENRAMYDPGLPLVV